MFSLRPGDELVFGNPTAVSQPDKISDNLMVDHAFEESNIISFSSSIGDDNKKQQLGQTQFGFRQRETRSREVYNDRGVRHRDVERKRRQEMSNLYASLRALLPVEHSNKGKRSMCDHMQEAANYIKRKQEKIQELQIRRDKLKRLSNLSGLKVGSSNGGDDLPNFVMVNLELNGVEILISCSAKNSSFRLSQVLAELLERELNVISCVSTKTEGRFLHKIQAEVIALKPLDLAVLQERLSHVID